MRIERKGQVALMRLESGKANAIGASFLERLDGLIAQLGDARAAVITGQGSAFCAGGFAQVDVERLTLRMNGITLFAAGEPTEAHVPLDGPVCKIELDLGLGTGSAAYLASDLTYDYVRINAEYTT